MSLNSLFFCCNCKQTQYRNLWFKYKPSDSRTPHYLTEETQFEILEYQRGLGQFLRIYLILVISFETATPLVGMKEF